MSLEVPETEKHKMDKEKIAKTDDVGSKDTKKTNEKDPASVKETKKK